MRWTKARVAKHVRGILDRNGFEHAIIERVAWLSPWCKGLGDPSAEFRTAHVEVTINGRTLLKSAQIERGASWLRLC